MKNVISIGLSLLASQAFAAIQLPNNAGSLVLTCKGEQQVITANFSANELVTGDNNNILTLKGVRTQGRLGPDQKHFAAPVEQVEILRNGLRLRAIATSSGFTTGIAASLIVTLPGVDANSAQGKVTASLNYLRETRLVRPQVGTPFHWDCEYVIARP